MSSATKDVLFEVQDACDKLETEGKYVESLEFRVRALELCREEYGEGSEEAEEMYLNISHLNCVVAREHLSARNLGDASCYLRALENLTMQPLSHTNSNLRRLLHRGRMFDLYSVFKQLQGRPQCGLRYAEKAATIFIRLGSTSDIPPCFLNLSVLSSNLGLHKPALQHAYNALHATHELMTGTGSDIKARVSLADIHPEEATKRRSTGGRNDLVNENTTEAANLENMLFDENIEIPESRKISDMLATTEQAYKQEEQAMFGSEDATEGNRRKSLLYGSRSYPVCSSPSQGILNSMLQSELAHASEFWSSLQQTYPRFSNILRLKYDVEIPVENVIRQSFEDSQTSSVIDRLAVLAMTESGTTAVAINSNDKSRESTPEESTIGSRSRPPSGRMDRTISFNRMIPNFRRKAEQIRILRTRKTSRIAELQKRSEKLFTSQDDYSASAHFSALRLQCWWRMLLAIGVVKKRQIRSAELSRRQSTYAMGTTAAKITAERIPSSGKLPINREDITKLASTSEGPHSKEEDQSQSTKSSAVTSPDNAVRKRKKNLATAAPDTEPIYSPKEKIKKRATVNDKIDKNDNNQPEYDEEADSTLPKMLLSKSYSRIAAEQEFLGDFEESIESHQLALQTLRDSFGKSHPATRRAQKELNTTIAARKRKKNENLAITPLLLQTSQRRKIQTTERHQARVAASLFTRRTQVGVSLSPPKKRNKNQNQLNFSYQSSYAADPAASTSLNSPFGAPKSGNAGRALRHKQSHHHPNGGHKILQDLTGSVSRGSDCTPKASASNVNLSQDSVETLRTRQSRKSKIAKEIPKAGQVGITPVTNWVQKAHAPPRQAAENTGAARIDVDNSYDAHPAVLSAIHQRQGNVVKAHDTWVRTALEGTSDLGKDLGLSTADIAFLSSTFNLSLTTRPLGTRRLSNKKNNSVDPIDNIRQRMIHQREEASSWLEQLKQNPVSDY